MQYYDPMFYISSSEMPFTFCLAVRLQEPVAGETLTAAVRAVGERYPYFAVRVVRQEEDWLAVPNETPLPVYQSPALRALGSAEVAGHLCTVSYWEDQIYFCASHVMTDGNGFFPFLRAVLCMYIALRYGVEEEKARSLCTQPFFPDELGNPYPEEKMAAAEPFGAPPSSAPFFRLTDGGYVTDERRTAYRLRFREDDFMRFSRDHDGSPCAMVSALMTQAVWSLHPEESRDVVSAISCNIRPGLGCPHNYRMLSNALPLRYPARLRALDIRSLCTVTRGKIMLQSQPENILCYAQRQREWLEATLAQAPSLEERCRVFGRRALEDSVAATFSVSYAGKVDLGPMEPYVRSMYVYTDGSVHRSLFIEISSLGGWFTLNFLQGFSSDVYYRAFLQQLEQNGIAYEQEASLPLKTPAVVLPQ